MQKADLGRREQPLGTAQLVACLLKFPLMTWNIVVGIHWEALKLRRNRGARFRSRPPIAEPVSTWDQATAFEPGE
ncbi:DUF1365 family protein [Mesorhizobium sp. M0293]|uniref:DUF1365 family protein n=1 Tax=Mesorhizobium sp. M0293 TaxID=2956930 RepID=UPI00333DF3BA